MINLEIKNGEIDLPALGNGLLPPQKYVYTGNGQFKNNDGNLTLSFDQPKNGKSYLKLNAYINIPGLGQTVMAMYEYQKLDSKSLNQSTKPVWEDRNGKSYYALDEKINSVMYLTKALLTKNISVDINHGYAIRY